MVVYLTVEKRSEEVHTYKSLAELTRDLEPIDVSDNVYDVYDSQGQVYNLSVRKSSKAFLGLIPISQEEITAKASGQFQEERLKQAVLRYTQIHNIEIDESSLKSIIRDLGEV